MEKVSPQVRVLALVLVLVGLGGMMALRTLGPKVEPVAAPLPAPKAVVHKAPAKAAPAKAAPAKAAPAKAKVVKASPPAKAKPASTARAAASVPKPAPKVPEPKTGLPVAVDAALANHELVVVSLVVPGARVDELAAAEARAGAQLAGVGYLALNVLNEDVARALLQKLGTLEDPSLLLIRRGGEVALKLNGFVDRDTVAQAAANASA